jgi:hypothetical protein
MSVNAMRALVLLANLVLVGLIVWLCYGTFVTLDLERYDVKPPKAIEIPDRGPDLRSRDKLLYVPIGRVLDPTPPAPPPPPPPPEAAKPPKPSPKDIKVVAINFSEDQELASALLLPPGASEPHFMQVGLDLAEIKGFGLDAYAGWKLKQITRDEVIVVDQAGQEVRLTGPRPITQGAGGH